MKKTVLSVLVPAYNYPEGVGRILRALTPLPESVELIIYDDSPNYDVQIVVAACKEDRISSVAVNFLNLTNPLSIKAFKT